MSGRRWRRLGFFAPLVLVAILFAMRGFVIRRIGGAYSHAPSELKQGLSDPARALLEKAWEGVDPARLLDYHVHVVGLGAGGTGAFVNPEMRSWWHATKRLKFEIYAHAAGVTDFDHADQQFVARLVDQIRNIPRHGKYLLLAFDKHYSAAGKPVPEQTEFYLPNDYVFALVERYPDLFEAACSVHPYRPDALDELTRCAQRGARVLKWLPNAMGIDPADPRCIPFYDRMKELGIALLSHAGAEYAVDAEGAQKLGNPLRLRLPLDRGVTVIAAHCAGLGGNEDLDSPGREWKSNFELFLRLMGEKKYDGLLYGEISGTTQFNRLPGPLLELLRRRDLHPRLLNGSDYPLPAINTLFRTSDLVDLGVITEAERAALNEIYDYNPLLFDFVVKRTLRDPETKLGFAPSVFERMR